MKEAGEEGEGREGGERKWLLIKRELYIDFLEVKINLDLSEEKKLELLMIFFLFLTRPTFVSLGASRFLKGPTLFLHLGGTVFSPPTSLHLKEA